MWSKTVSSCTIWRFVLKRKYSLSQGEESNGLYSQSSGCGREREKESWVWLEVLTTTSSYAGLQDHYPLMGLALCSFENGCQWELSGWVMRMKHVTSTVCRLEGPSWLFIIDPFLHRLLVITNLPFNRETPRMPWHPAVSYLFTLEMLKNRWLCGICSDTHLEKTEGKGNQKRTIL